MSAPTVTNINQRSCDNYPPPVSHARALVLLYVFNNACVTNTDIEMGKQHNVMDAGTGSFGVRDVARESPRHGNIVKYESPVGCSSGIGLLV